MAEKEKSYLVCPNCGGRLSTWSRKDRVVVTCEGCEYQGFEILGITEKLLKSFNNWKGTLAVTEKERKN